MSRRNSPLPALHIHGALLLYMFAMVLFRQTRRSRFPWLFVLLVLVLNEWADLREIAGQLPISRATELT